MPIQTIFGAGLASSVPLGDLGDSDSQSARWTLQRHDQQAPSRECTRIGTSEIFPDVWGHLDRCADGGFRFFADNAGTFDISADGRRFDWYP
ncbi:MAG: hypothetical protein M3081_12445, partial [Gemmatimonadota bacterium]|nr:hypothetical protein [Gemmatimonadota bacterium]